MTPTWDGLGRSRKHRWLSMFARLKPGVSARSRPQRRHATCSTASVSEDELAQMKNPLPARDARSGFLAQQLELRPAAQGINPLRADWETPLAGADGDGGAGAADRLRQRRQPAAGARGGRQKEIAIRLAIGAGRRPSCGSWWSRASWSSLAGGLAGLCVAIWTTRRLLRCCPEMPTGGWLAAGLDLRTLGFSLLLSRRHRAAVRPGAGASRPRARIWAPALKDQSASVAASGGQARFRRLFIVAQVALSLLLLVGAGLFARSLFNLMTDRSRFSRREAADVFRWTRA